MNTSLVASKLLTGKRKLIILPVGSIEQHGPYLPIDTDLRITQMLAEKLIDSLRDIDPLLLPAIPFSSSWEHKGIGTIALNVSTLSAILHDVAYSIKTWKIPILLILVNWHGGNSVLASLAAEITARGNIPTAVIPSTSEVGKAWNTSDITSSSDVHAGAIETSIIQAYWPNLVDQAIPLNVHFEPDIQPAKAQAVLQAIGTYTITETGIWGAPEQANQMKGIELIEKLSKSMLEQTKKLLQLADYHTGEA